MLTSILTLRCPRCRKGKLFEDGSFIRPGSLFKMHSHCSHCNQSFEPEPGFYFGAMFISYAINTAFFILTWVALKTLYPAYTLSLLLVLLTCVVILGLPLTFKLSRSIWLAIFVRYDPTALKKG
jgi:uncharacterized protein (DUF983 family)